MVDTWSKCEPSEGREVLKQNDGAARITCARAAYDAVVDDGTAVDCNLQAVVCIVVLGGFVIRVKLQKRQHTESDVDNRSKCACEPIWSFFKKMNALHL